MMAGKITRVPMSKVQDSMRLLLVDIRQRRAEFAKHKLAGVVSMLDEFEQVCEDLIYSEDAHDHDQDERVSDEEEMERLRDELDALYKLTGHPNANPPKTTT